MALAEAAELYSAGPHDGAFTGMEGLRMARETVVGRYTGRALLEFGLVDLEPSPKGESVLTDQDYIRQYANITAITCVGLTSSCAGEQVDPEVKKFIGAFFNTELALRRTHASKILSDHLPAPVSLPRTHRNEQPVEQNLLFEFAQRRVFREVHTEARLCRDVIAEKLGRATA